MPTSASSSAEAPAEVPARRWVECTACRAGLGASGLGALASQQCDLCARIGRLLVVLRRLPRGSPEFEHSLDVVESLTRLACADGEEAEVYRPQTGTTTDREVSSAGWREGWQGRWSEGWQEGWQQ